jgi:hypothetical protein
LTCGEQFCKKCEIKIKENEKHVCKDEDLESIKTVDSLVKCPKCKLPVVKSYGCHNMTCSICKTNFDYITGTITRAGNHSNDNLVLKNFSKFTNIMINDGFTDNYVLNKIREIENSETENYSFNNILSPLKKYIILENEHADNLEIIQNELYKYSEKIAENYEIYKLEKYKKKKYYKYMSLINYEYKNNSLNNEFIDKIYNLVFTY